MPTDTRIIVVYRGKRGAGALATGQLFGGLSGAFEDLFKSGKESISKPRGSQSPKEILASNKDNFAIGLDEIVKGEVEETSPLVDLTILTKNEKLEFSARLRVDRRLVLPG